MQFTSEVETGTRSCGGDNDSERIIENENEEINMETETTSFRRYVEKRKNRLDEEDGDFITVNKRKAKRLLREGTLQKENNKLNLAEKHEVCITSLSALPSQMAMARLLLNEKIEGVIKIKYKSSFKVLINFTSDEAAEKLINCKKFGELDYRCQKTYEKKVTYGMIRGVDLAMEEKEVLSVLECDFKILSLKRLKRLSSEGVWVESESIRVCFESISLPKYVIAYGCRMTVEPFVFPVTRCSGCWKFGHILKFCPTKKPLCPKCGDANHSNCEITEFKCLNCKGPHFVLDIACPLFIKEKEIRKIMSNENVTYKRALQIMNLMKKLDEEDNEEHITDDHKESENTNQSYSSFTTARSYRNVLISAQVHKDSDICMSEEDREEIRPHTSSKEIHRKKKVLKTKQNHSEKVEEKQKDNSADRSERKSHKENIKRKFDLKQLLQKIQSIIFSKESFESKVFSMFVIIFEECKMFLTNIVWEANLFEKFLGLLNNYNNG